MAAACGYHSHSHQSKDAPVGAVPEALQVVFLAWASGFSKSVFPNFATLVLGAVLTTGRRTVSHILLTIGELYRERPRLTQTPPERASVVFGPLHYRFQL